MAKTFVRDCITCKKETEQTPSFLATCLKLVCIVCGLVTFTKFPSKKIDPVTKK